MRINSKYPEMTLEYAASAIRNCLRLLTRYENQMTESDGNKIDNTSFTSKPGNPLSNAAQKSFKMHAYLIGAFLQLQLENWVSAIEYCDRILDRLKNTVSTNDYYLYWLAYTYKATAYINSGCPKKAAVLLIRAMTLISETGSSTDGDNDTNGMIDDQNPDQIKTWKTNTAINWQNQIYDKSGISNFYGVSSSGGRMAKDNLQNYGSSIQACQSSLTSNVNEWRLLNLTNLAVVYCLNSKTQQAVAVLEKASMFLNRNIQNSQNGNSNSQPIQLEKSSKSFSLGQQQYDSVGCYLRRTQENNNNY